jgi:flagellar protein FlaG
VGLEAGRTSVVDVQVLQNKSLGISPSVQSDQIGQNDQSVQNVKADNRGDQQHQEQKSTTKDDMQKAIKTLNKLISPHHTNLHFAFHEKLDRYFVQIVDSDTHQVIKEIPPKKFLDAHAATLELLGFLVDKRV